MIPIAGVAPGSVDDVRRWGRNLKDKSNRTIRKELYKSITTAVEPAEAAIRESAEAILPKAGKLGEAVGTGLVFKVSKRLGGNSVGVTMKATWPGHDLRSINRGRVFHPYYGRGKYGPQTVPEGFWDKPIEGPVAKQAKDSVRQALVRARDQITAGR